MLVENSESIDDASCVAVGTTANFLDTQDANVTFVNDAITDVPTGVVDLSVIDIEPQDGPDNGINMRTTTLPTMQDRELRFSIIPLPSPTSTSRGTPFRTTAPLQASAGSPTPYGVRSGRMNGFRTPSKLRAQLITTSTMRRQAQVGSKRRTPAPTSLDSINPTI